MRKLRQAMHCCAYSFLQWRGNARVIITFCLAFILCFLLTERTATFAAEHSTTLQILEPFVWTFGDGSNVLLASLLLLLLFGDMPFISAGTPLFLLRTTRRAWLTGEVLYIAGSTTLYALFVLLSTCTVCAPIAFAGNQWSEAAALLGFSRLGSVVGVPASTITMEMSRPAAAAFLTFLLLLLYMLVLGLLMLAVHLAFGRRAALSAAVAFSLWGLLLEPDLFVQLLHLPERQLYRANLLSVWLSPLNQATLPLHSFGYNALPTIPQSTAVFLAAAAGLYIAALCAAKRLQFLFTGTDQ